MPTVQANGLSLEYESFGRPEDPPLLLIMGLGAQMVIWPLPLCQQLAAAGYYVIRFDNRDIGLSSRLSHLGKPRLMLAGIAQTLGMPLRAPYSLDDMAQDTVGLMDALGFDSAHVVGLSMGGMIAQLVAARHPARVRSLTLIMTSSGNPRLPAPSLKLRLRLVKPPAKFDRDSLINHGIQTWRLIGSPAYPADETALREMVSGAFDRSHHPRGVARQTAAILAARSRVPLLKRIIAPTLVLHGQDDPLVPVAAARELVRHIAGARLEEFPGMGHDLPAVLLPRIGELIIAHADGAAARSE